MDKKQDDFYFNASEAHEVDYVVRQYEDREGVKEFIKQKSKEGVIKNFTHVQLYELLDQAGYKKK